MKCEECITTLEEFLDGELDEQAARATSAHFIACPVCAEAYEELQAEQALYARYERDVEVTPQMWSGVAARIDAETRKPAGGTGLLQRVREWLAPALTAPRFSPVLTAAMMLLAIGATAAVMKFVNSKHDAPVVASAPQPNNTTTAHPNVVQPSPDASPTTAPTATEVKEPNANQGGERERNKPEPQRKRETEHKLSAPTTATDPAAVQNASLNNDVFKRKQATEKLVREAESKYLAAIQMLSEDVKRNRSHLDPQVAARFDETLAAIDRSIAETRRTVLKHENDPVAVQYMLSAYAKKVEVMREIAGMD